MKNNFRLLVIVVIVIIISGALFDRTDRPNKQDPSDLVANIGEAIDLESFDPHMQLLTSAGVEALNDGPKTGDEQILVKIKKSSPQTVTRAKDILKKYGKVKAVKEYKLKKTKGGEETIFPVVFDIDKKLLAALLKNIQKGL